MSLFSITPDKTRMLSISPPGTFSTRAYRLMSTMRTPASSAETDGIERETAHEVCPANDELGPDRAFDECEYMLVVARVDRDGDSGDDLERDLVSFVVGRDGDDQMDVALNLREGLGKDLPRCNPRGSSRRRYLSAYG